MIQLNEARGLVEKMITLNSFDMDINKYPFIVVLRNTIIGPGNEYIYQEDTGMNNCDTILLVDQNNILALSGRSYANDKYQKRMVDKTDKANYIETSFIKKAFRKGKHLQKYPALVQNVAFMVKRSLDMDLRDEDDYSEYKIVCDNFHGFAPGSAGCITVEGQMSVNPKVEEMTGDWKVAFNWLYNIHKNDTFFSAALIFFEDIELINKGVKSLRFGSYGPEVIKLQQKLQIKLDGDFGPVTYDALNEKYPHLNGYIQDIEKFLS